MSSQKPPPESVKVPLELFQMAKNHRVSSLEPSLSSLTLATLSDRNAQDPLKLAQDAVGRPSQRLGATALVTDGPSAGSTLACDLSLSFGPTMSRYAAVNARGLREVFAARDHDSIRRCREMIKILECANYLHAAVQDQLTKFLVERVGIDRRLMDEWTTLTKRREYLKDCRAAADKEEKLVLREISTANLLLAAAKEKQASAAAYRATARQELKFITSAFVFPAGRDLYQDSQGNCVTEKLLESHAIPSPVGPTGVKLDLPRIHQPMFIDTSAPASTATTLPTPPDSPESSPDTHSSKSDGTVNSDKDPALEKSEHTKSHFVSSDAPVERQISLGFLSQPSSENLAHLPQDSTGSTCESPIGPYVRPPMPIEDMRRCIRCLLGKDKSLKTGNHARAFLGLPWSDIVSFDPDMLLARGVSGIKEGSTGMASRLRMMTIIESALSNQNNDAIGVDVWERPTFFCESCQERYPISVDTSKAVMTFEEYEEMRVRDVPNAPTPVTTKTVNSHSHQHAGSKNVVPVAPRRKRSSRGKRCLKLTSLER